MKDDPPQLITIEQLSREYDEKYRDLEKLISENGTEDIAPRLMELAERAAARFRYAQGAILSLPGLFEADTGKKLVPFLIELFRTFDEMRILFQSLFENRAQ